MQVKIGSLPSKSGGFASTTKLPYLDDVLPRDLTTVAGVETVTQTFHDGGEHLEEGGNLTHTVLLVGQI